MIESGGQKKKGRGVLKGIKVAKKRFANGSSKLHIEFSKTLGGSIGENYRSFVDDVVVFMKRKAPLIGVNKWSNIDSSVKDSIVADVIVSISLYFGNFHSLSNIYLSLTDSCHSFLG